MYSTANNPAGRELEWEDAGGLPVVRLEGRDLREEQEVTRLFRQLDSLTGERRCSLLLDLASVEPFASYFIGKLLGLHKRFEARGGRLALCGLTPALERTLGVMRLDRVFHVYASEQEARSSFSEVPQPTSRC